MKCIYFLIWLSIRNITKVNTQVYKSYGRGGFSGYIVGGIEVPIAMYPHVAKLHINRFTLCGGSIISDRLIVTAAHCVINKSTKRIRPPSAFRVTVGTSARHFGTRYYVCKVVPHKLYRPFRYFYDIAVLILNRRIKFTPTIQKVKIAPNESWRSEKYSFTLAGFGRVNTKAASSHKLKATRMHYVDTKTCNDTQAYYPMPVADHMFCMIGQKWTSDCNGDSGSGVVWRGYLVGLVSIGRDKFCGSDMMPSMYTDITYFRKWLYSNMKKAESLSEHECEAETKKQKLAQSSYNQCILSNITSNRNY